MRRRSVSKNADSIIARREGARKKLQPNVLNDIGSGNVHQNQKAFETCLTEDCVVGEQMIRCFHNDILYIRPSVLLDVKRFHDCTYPVAYHRETKCIFLHCFGNEFVSFDRLDIEEISVCPEHGVCHDKTDSLVPIEEGVVVCERFHQSRCFLDKVTVIAVLCTQNGGLQEAPISNTVESTEFLD